MGIGVELGVGVEMGVGVVLGVGVGVGDMCVWEVCVVLFAAPSISILSNGERASSPQDTQEGRWFWDRLQGLGGGAVDEGFQPTDVDRRTL